MAKLDASEAAHRAADKAMQILASKGYQRGSVVERLFRDVRATEIYQGMPDAEAVNTVTFTEAGGRTTLTILGQHASKEHRDAHIASGMEAGLQDALGLLEQVASSLR